MHISTLQMQYGISFENISKSLASFNANNHLDSFNNGNSANWLISHITATRQIPLMFAGQETIWKPEQIQRWGREPTPLVAAEAIDWQQLLGDLETSGNMLMGFLATANEETLAIETPVGKIGSALAFLVSHEHHHSGQLAYLASAIKSQE